MTGLLKGQVLQVFSILFGDVPSDMELVFVFMGM